MKLWRSVYISFPNFRRRVKLKGESPNQSSIDFLMFEEQKNKDADLLYNRKHNRKRKHKHKHKHEHNNYHPKMDYNGYYADSRTIRGQVKFFCPIGSVLTQYRCNSSVNSEFRGWITIGSLFIHIQEHCRSGQFHMIPRKYWKKYSKKYCLQCKTVCSINSRFHRLHKSKDQHSIEQPKPNQKIQEKRKDNDEEKKTVTVDVDYGLPSFDDIWKFFVPTIRNIPGKLINEWTKIVAKHFCDELTTLYSADSNCECMGKKKNYLWFQDVYGLKLNLEKSIVKKERWPNFGEESNYGMKIKY